MPRSPFEILNVQEKPFKDRGFGCVLVRNQSVMMDSQKTALVTSFEIAKEEQDERAFQEEENNDPSGSEDDVGEADISKIVCAKRKRLEVDTKALLQVTTQKLEQIWQTEKEQRNMIQKDYSQHFLTIFKQWDKDIQKAEECKEKLGKLIYEQQKVYQQLRLIQSQRLNTIKQICEQFSKVNEEMEKKNEIVLIKSQNEIEKEFLAHRSKIRLDSRE
ncbi:synaptonemal complex protein 3 isoform X4 [Ornithorhynchus anatinus]|uniref:synaptonemal complex protein 3 isoform X4 n=1 Tax=Ornithorhynchus anatinus TaxID=9258 RepID=UPI0010A87315|nr:synaptonemal complex protein 3 isoform X4 [Ornithorhynchus anatinus]